MRSTLSLSLALGFTVVWGFTTRPADAAPVRFTELPIQVHPQVPDMEARPRSIPEGEHVDGVFVGDRTEGGDSSYESIGLFSTPAPALKYVTDPYGYLTVVDFRRGPCFHTANPFERAAMLGPEAQEWPAFAQPFAEVTPYAAENAVTAVRVERLVSDAAGDRLEATEFWIDPVTAGQRLIRRSNLALSRVATPSDGVVVFVARTGEQRAEIVVYRGPSQPEEDLFAGLPKDFPVNDGVLGFTTSVDGALGSSSLSGQCGHLRFHMEPPQEPVDPSTFQNFVPTRETASVTSDVVVGVVVARAHGHDDLPPLLAEVTSRKLTLNFGLSRMSADEEPLLAVSYRWSSPPLTAFVQQQRMFDALLVAPAMGGGR
jgi:hypothetical protein